MNLKFTIRDGYAVQIDMSPGTAPRPLCSLHLKIKPNETPDGGEDVTLAAFSLAGSFPQSYVRQRLFVLRHAIYITANNRYGRAMKFPGDRRACLCLRVSHQSARLQTNYRSFGRTCCSGVNPYRLSRNSPDNMLSFFMEGNFRVISCLCRWIIRWSSVGNRCGVLQRGAERFVCANGK